MSSISLNTPTPFEQLLHQAVQLSEAERSRLLREHPDQSLAQRVRELFFEEASLGDFLQPKERQDEKAGLRLPFLRAAAGAQAGTRGGAASRRSSLTARTRGLQPEERLVHAARAFGIGSLGVAGILYLRSLMSETPLTELTAEMIALAGVLSLSLVLGLVAARAELSRRQLLWLGSGFVAIGSIFVALFHAAIEIRAYGEITPFGPYVLLIGLFPLIVPMRPRHTAVLAVIAALVTFTVLIVADRILGSRESSALDLLLGPLTGASTAFLLAGALHRLRERLEEVRHLGSYELDEKLGEGGMGEVWAATHQLLARPTAIKLVRPEFLGVLNTGAGAVLERFTREARATASLRSIHTVDIYDFGLTEDGTFFIAMEMLDGIDLATLVKQRGPQSASMVREVLLHACDSLGEAHDRGLIHRDIKPANLMLCRFGQRQDVLKVLDFGIVTITTPGTARGSATLTQKGELMGTPGFVAPEVLEDRGVDARSDLYSLGCVAYWLLAGRNVFSVESRAEVAAAHLRDQPPSFEAVGVEVPDALSDIVMRCLEKSPDRRFESAEALARALRDWEPSALSGDPADG